VEMGGSWILDISTWLASGRTQTARAGPWHVFLDTWTQIDLGTEFQFVCQSRF
jgi:hypothetical protein